MSATQMELGEQRKQQGLEKVSANAVEFLDEIRAYAVGFAKSSGVVCVDDLREFAAEHGIKPHHPNAWGAVFHCEGWELHGYTKSRWPVSHRRTISVWRWVG